MIHSLYCRQSKTNCFKYAQHFATQFWTNSTTNMTSEKFCLKWNDFQENIANSFQGLREDLDFSDVTLVCEETSKSQPSLDSRLKVEIESNHVTKVRSTGRNIVFLTSSCCVICGEITLSLYKCVKNCLRTRGQTIITCRNKNWLYDHIYVWATKISMWHNVLEIIDNTLDVLNYRETTRILRYFVEFWSKLPKSGKLQVLRTGGQSIFYEKSKKCFLHYIYRSNF